MLTTQFLRKLRRTLDLPLSRSRLRTRSRPPELDLLVRSALLLPMADALAWCKHGKLVVCLGMAVALGLASCASAPKLAKPKNLAQAERHIAQLQTDLLALSPQVHPEESARVASAAVNRSRELAAQYNAIRPAALHNVWVNMGWRERGLCYHWAEDLEAALTQLGLASLAIHPCVARSGTYREHNALVITARDQPFLQGIVLDAWRHSGLLYWGPVQADRYPWIPLCGHPQCAAAVGP